MTSIVFPYSNLLALTPTAAKQGLEFIYNAWFFYHKHHNEAPNFQNQYHPDILERYLIPYRDILHTRVLGQDTYYLTDRTAATFHDQIIATWVMVGECTRPTGWDPLYPQCFGPLIMFQKWQEQDIKYPPFPMDDLSHRLVTHAFRSIEELRTVLHQVQAWATFMRELARLYACYMRTPGWEKYSQKGIQHSPTFLAAASSWNFGAYIEIITLQEDEDVPTANSTATTPSSLELPSIPASLSSSSSEPEAPSPEYLTLKSETEEDSFNFIDFLNQHDDKPSFPTLDPVPTMPGTYSVPLLPSEGEMKEEAEDDNSGEGSISLPTVPPVPQAWETWDRHIRNVRHNCNTIIFCAYCAWVQETGCDVNPKQHYILKGRIILNDHPFSRDVTDQLMEGTRSLEQYYQESCPLRYPEDTPVSLTTAISEPTFQVRPQTPFPTKDVIYVTSSSSESSDSSHHPTTGLTSKSLAGYSEVEASARRIIKWLQDPDHPVNNLEAMLPNNGILEPFDFNSPRLEVDDHMERLLSSTTLDQEGTTPTILSIYTMSTCSSPALSYQSGLNTPPNSPLSYFHSIWGGDSTEGPDLHPWMQPDTTEFWDMDWPLNIWVLGGEGKPGHWVHYHHWEHLDDWKYVKFPTSYGSGLPQDTYYEANMGAREDAFDFWAKQGQDPNDWIECLVQDYWEKENWAKIGRDKLETMPIILPKLDTMFTKVFQYFAKIFGFTTAPPPLGHGLLLIANPVKFRSWNPRT
ncbi:hypothetical protein FRC11_012855, partial [Ceratobasidium sp. 423]